jgi:hypothetical protein
MGLFLYYSFKKNAFFNPIDSYIGLGDVLFFFSITPLFSLHGFVKFFVLSLLFSLGVHFLFFKKNQKKHIPLAGYMAVFLLLVLFSELILKTTYFFYE